MAIGHAIIVGAGPAGASLGFMLARRGIGVTLLERHADFERTFRGDGLQPSGMTVFDQMGVGNAVRQLPHVAIKTIELYQRGRKRATLSSEALGFVANFVPQPNILRLLTTESQSHANFELCMATSVSEVLKEDGRIVGVIAQGPEGKRQITGDMVIATDGRYSTLRKRGVFEDVRTPQHFDVLNFIVPMPKFWPDHETVRLELGDGCLTGGIPTADRRLWVGMTIDKGRFKSMKAGGEESLTQELLKRTSPELGAHLVAHPDTLRNPVLLDVMVGRVRNWTNPGLLLLGDAAHPMSPNGGQGINMALRDAVITANRLGPSLARGANATELDAAASAVMNERLPEIAAIQQYQRKQTQAFLGADGLKSRIGMKLLPFLASSGLLRALIGKRLGHLQHGTAKVQLEF